jgi:hypothetical protein
VVLAPGVNCLEDLMTKLISLMIVSAFTLAACGGGTKKSDTTTSNDTSTEPAKTDATQTAGEGTPCAQEIAIVCPDDQIDGCLKTPMEGDTHKCVAK